MGTTLPEEEIRKVYKNNNNILNLSNREVKVFLKERGLSEKK